MQNGLRRGIYGLPDLQESIKVKGDAKMAYKTDDIRGWAQDGLHYSNEQGGDALYQEIKRLLIDEIRARNIPALFKDDFMKSGGLFGTKCPMLVVSNPNPGCRFFDIGFYVSGPTVSFPLLGESVENTKNNKKNYYKENGQNLKAALIKVDDLKLQEEAIWRTQILECFNDLNE